LKKLLNTLKNSIYCPWNIFTIYHKSPS